MDKRRREPLPALPARIEGLGRLAYNLWWSWDRPAWRLFQRVSHRAWRESGHNPIRMLVELPEEALATAAENDGFLAQYDAVMARFEKVQAIPLTAKPSAAMPENLWFPRTYGTEAAPLTYFSAEYGLDASLPVYAGGLGVLAGDYLKECSDLAVPIVAVGMIYAHAYVHQRIRQDGWQAEVEETLDRTYHPITRLLDDNGEPLRVRVPALEPALHVGIWQVKAGRVRLYLLDPNVEGNRPWDREIANRLYVSDKEQRLRQQILLGMGGMRVLEALDVAPGALHLNEGHPWLTVLERIRPLVEAGATFESALDEIRPSTIFTTHTPVPAGVDVFPFNMVGNYLGGYLSELGIDRDTFFELGSNPHDPEAGFNTTVFALRVAGHRNAVSERHGEVARQMWAHLWPEREPDDVPIKSITNGVHLPTWIAPGKLQPVFDEVFGEDWVDRQDEVETWDGVDEIADDRLWAVHQALKADLLAEIDERAQHAWQAGGPAGKVVALGALLDPELLTLGFARRFTGYKRPTLIFHDMDRFRKLVTDPRRPVQVIFAGEAHPDDTEGKRLIQRIVQTAQDPAFAGRIAFLEDYDKELASYLVHGVDVWLNNPVPALEASGTSGMKACVNGVPNLSISSGWWIEGHTGENGWAFGDGDRDPEAARNDEDAAALYRLLEEEIVPSYYDQAGDGWPPAFVAVMRAAIKSVAPHFGTRRMVKAYVNAFYSRALGLEAARSGDRPQQ